MTHPSKKNVIKNLDRKPSVMVVDDNEELRTVMEDVLKDEGYNVSTAVDGKDALEQLLNTISLPDILITDLNMPNITGQELVAVLRAIDKTRHLPIMVYSGSLHVEYDPRLEDCLFIQKPFDVSKLITTLRSLTISTTTTIVSNGGFSSTVKTKEANCD